jgi:hypothetical protein
MHQSFCPFILVALLSLIVSIKSCSIRAIGDKGSDKWYGESLLFKTTDVTNGCYNATLKNDYVHHDYFFTAALCDKNQIYIKVDTPHGAKDRQFKFNFNKAGGTQIISLATQADQDTCDFENPGYPDFPGFDHITVQESKGKSEGSGKKCWWLFCGF